MATEIVSTIKTIVKLGLEIKTRVELFKQAGEDFKTLITSLSLLLPLFEDKETARLFDNNQEELAHILGIFKSIAESCAKCAKRLDTTASKTRDPTAKKDACHWYGKKSIRKKTKETWAFLWIHDIVGEIEHKSRILQQICATVTARLVIQNGQERNAGNAAQSTIVAQTTVPLEMTSGTMLAGIGEIIVEVMKECKELRRRLQQAVLLPDASYTLAYEARNPEAVSFWRDRFQKGELNVSAIRYEKFYVSWARFVHIVETSLVLTDIPTSVFIEGDIDVHHEQGSKFRIDQHGTCELSSIRPLWLPALRQALDPIHKGYVKPEDYFALLRGLSLTQTIRTLICQSSGYGVFVECERASGDLALPAALECPQDHVGWISAQLVTVPTSHELGILSDDEISDRDREAVFTSFSQSNRDIQVNVRYLQTGQIESKSLTKQIRPIGAIAVGTELSIYHQLESGSYAWSRDLRLTQFKASAGGRYILTTGTGPDTMVFSTKPLQDSFEDALTDHDVDNIAIPEASFTLLGPSKVFRCPPQIGEKIQVEHDGLWYDVRVTAVDSDDVEYVDWTDSDVEVKINAIDQIHNQVEEEEEEDYYFREDELAELGKGHKRAWRPWRKGFRYSSVRPYRRFHIGDLIEAPVMYPDFRGHYHVIEHSQLYLPARIVSVQEDQYTVEFDPDSLVYEWWPGRRARDENIETIPGSGNTIKNPFDNNRVMLNMDLVRPYLAGARPVLGLQSVKPDEWETYQGVHLRKLENLMEQSLWGSDHVSL